MLGGTKFYERAEIKDAMAYLVSIANPYDPLAWSRLLGAPKRGIGPMAEAQLALFADAHEISYHEAMTRASELSFGPKVLGAITRLGDLLTRAANHAAAEVPAPVFDILKLVLDESEMITKLREKRDAQDEARAENLEELLSVAKEFDTRNPGAGLIEFLTEVSLVAAADELDDASGTVSLMTLHTAKGLEFDTVFLTGLEEGLIPHQMSVDEIGGISEERRLMYVGITRARRKLYLSLASSRSQFGDIKIAMPSRFLQEIPQDLIEWRQSPGEVTSQGGTESRALNARPAGAQTWQRRRTAPTQSSVGFQGDSGGLEREGENMKSALDLWRERKRQAKEAGGSGFPNRIGAGIRDNGDLTLAPGDRIQHDDYGEGRVDRVTGTGTKQIAHVIFDSVGERKLLIKLAPITKL